MRLLLFPAVFAMLAACAPSAVPKGGGADAAAIEARMHRQFDRPDAALQTGPVAVAGDYAVADWTQGALGGRALFRRQDGGWTLVLCSGDSLRDAAALDRIGVPAADAASLGAALSAAERQVAPERIAAMKAFPGTVRAGEMQAR